MKRKLTCFCEEKIEVDFPVAVDLSEKEGSIETILEGSFMTVECPRCGNVLKPEYPVHIIDPIAGIDIFFIPERDRVAYFRKSLEYKVKNSKRIVIGYDELVEKILLQQYGLDDSVVEVIKYYLLNKALEEAESDKEVRILFHKKEGETLEFYARGIKEKEVGVLHVPVTSYNKVNSQLNEKRKEEPLSTILQSPYISVNKLSYMDMV